jgi:TetR/AcrR family transcriptional repressor of nem operon
MPRDGSATRDRILSAARRLVIDNGFGSTSVDAVIAASGTSKGAFFHHFASKQDLAAALVRQYVDEDIEFLHEGLAAAAAAATDPVDRAVAFVRFYEEAADEIMGGTTGCLYTSVLGELELVEAGTSTPITDAVVAWRGGFATLLRDAGIERRGLDPDALADHLWVTFEGAFLLARSTGDPADLRRQLGVLRGLLEVVLQDAQRQAFA